MMTKFKKSKLLKKILFIIVILWCIGCIIFLSGIIGGRYHRSPIAILFPKMMYPTPKTMEECQKLYQLEFPGGNLKMNPKKHYSRKEFDEIVHYALYPDKKPYDWIVNAGGLGAMYGSELPSNDPSLRDYEITQMTKAAINFLTFPQEGMRYEAAHLVLVHHLLGAAPNVAEALKVEKNPLVVQEMRDALKACGE